MKDKKLDGEIFWRLKYAIDDEVKRLGWSTEKCISHIQKHYKVRSRLLMTDEQLEDLLAHLVGLSKPQTTVSKLKTRKEKRKRRRKFKT